MSLGDIGSALDSEVPLPVTYVVSSFLSVALYNVAELTVTLFLTFKRRSGLYFWSFFTATWGIGIYSIGFILKDFGLARSISYFYVTLIVGGWCMMVTGQSLVLYSRLHLLMRNRLMLRLVLSMIIIDAVILHIPTIFLCYAANSPAFLRFVIPYSIYERVQVSIFFVQELIISGLYVYETHKMLRSEGEIIEIHGGAVQRLLLHLLLVSVIVVALDICILVLQFAGRYASQTAVKGFIYSVKLKLEFKILNRLVGFVQRSANSDSNLIDASGSRSSRNTQQGEQVTGEVLRHHFNCPLAIFARNVQRALGMSVTRYMSRVTHITKRQTVVQSFAEPGSVMIESEMVLQAMGSRPSNDYQLRGEQAVG